jgi:hypothetical protein
MPALTNDLDLKLDHAAAQALLRARIDERTKLIERNDAARKLARKLAELPAPAQDSPGIKALQAKVADAQTAANTHKAAFEAAKASAKVAHAVTATPAEEHFDPARGVLALKANPTALVQGRPAVERKRLAMDDKQCDEYAASYTKSCAAADEAFDLQRQIEDYRAAHPALFAGSPGEPPPVDPAYEALKAALADRQTIIAEEHARQGAIVQAVLAAAKEQVNYSLRIDIASGEVVLGNRPTD